MLYHYSMRALVTSAIVLVAVIMGLSAIVPSIQATSILSPLVAEQIAEDNGIGIDAVPKLGVCIGTCVADYRASVEACIAFALDEVAACIQAAQEALRDCITTCRNPPSD